MNAKRAVGLRIGGRAEAIAVSPNQPIATSFPVRSGSPPSTIACPRTGSLSGNGGDFSIAQFANGLVHSATSSVVCGTVPILEREIELRQPCNRVAESDISFAIIR